MHSLGIRVKWHRGRGFYFNGYVGSFLLRWALDQNTSTHYVNMLHFVEFKSKPKIAFKTPSCSSIFFHTKPTETGAKTQGKNIIERIKTENLKLTQKVALENGVTSIVILPNQTPKLNNPSIIDHIYKQSENNMLPKVNVYGAATKDDAGLEMSELGLMSEMGAVGFTNGNKSIKNSLFISRPIINEQLPK